jgi:predicted Zn-dependent protease
MTAANSWWRWLTAGPRWAWGSFRRLHPPIQYGFVLVSVIAVVALGYWYVDRRLKRLHNTAVAIAWHDFEVKCARGKLDEAKSALDAVAQLEPNSKRLTSTRRSLEAGTAEPDDKFMVQFWLLSHLRAGKTTEAASEATKYIQLEPANWLARTILAELALKAGKKEEAIAHLEALPPPDKVPPNFLLSTIGLREAVGLETRGFRDVLAINYVPRMRSPVVAQQATPSEKLLFVTLYLRAFADIALYTDLPKYWVDAAKLCRQIIDDPASETPTLLQLGDVQQRQLLALELLVKRKDFTEEEAVELFKELEDRIEANWKKVRDRDPKNSMAYLGLAFMALRRNQPTDALAVIDQGLAESDAKTDALVAQKSRILGLFDPKAGLNVLEEAIGNRSDSLPLCLLIVQAAEAAGRPDRALAACRQAKKLAPNLAWACYREAKICLDLNRPSDAIQAIEPLKADWATDPEAASLYVRALGTSGAASEITPFLEKVFAAAKSAVVPASAVYAVLQLNEPTLAFKWVEQAQKQWPTSREVDIIAATTHLMLTEPTGAKSLDPQHTTKAVAAYLRLQDREPKNLEVAANLAWLQLKGLKQPDAAYRAAAPLIAAEKTVGLSPQYRDTLGAVYVALGKYEDARNILEPATRHQTHHIVGVWIHLAAAYAGQQRRFEAQRCLDNALKLPRSAREQAEWEQINDQLKGKS